MERIFLSLFLLTMHISASDKNDDLSVGTGRKFLQGTKEMATNFERDTGLKIVYALEGIEDGIACLSSSYKYNNILSRAAFLTSPSTTKKISDTVFSIRSDENAKASMKNLGDNMKIIIEFVEKIAKNQGIEAHSAKLIGRSDHRHTEFFRVTDPENATAKPISLSTTSPIKVFGEVMTSKIQRVGNDAVLAIGALVEETAFAMGAKRSSYDLRQGIFLSQLEEFEKIHELTRLIKTSKIAEEDLSLVRELGDSIDLMKSNIRQADELASLSIVSHTESLTTPSPRRKLEKKQSFRDVLSDIFM